jgi:hypothetical protein
MAVNQAVQNTAARGLADSRRNCGDGNLNITFFINIFIIDELFILMTYNYSRWEERSSASYEHPARTGTNRGAPKQPTRDVIWQPGETPLTTSEEILIFRARVTLTKKSGSGSANSN